MNPSKPLPLTKREACLLLAMTRKAMHERAEEMRRILNVYDDDPLTSDKMSELDDCANEIIELNQLFNEIDAHIREAYE